MVSKLQKRSPATTTHSFRQQSTTTRTKTVGKLQKHSATTPDHNFRKQPTTTTAGKLQKRSAAVATNKQPTQAHPVLCLPLKRCSNTLFTNMSTFRLLKVPEIGNICSVSIIGGEASFMHYMLSNYQDTVPLQLSEGCYLVLCSMHHDNDCEMFDIRERGYT
jgi:hypothetical protein